MNKDNKLFASTCYLLLLGSAALYFYSEALSLVAFSLVCVAMLHHMNFKIPNIKNYKIKDFLTKTIKNSASNPTKNIETVIFTVLLFLILISPLLSYVSYGLGADISVPLILTVVSFILLNRVRDNYKFKDFDDNTKPLSCSFLFTSCRLEYAKEQVIEFLNSSYLLNRVKHFFLEELNKVSLFILREGNTTSFFVLSFLMLLISISISPFIGLLGFVAVFSIFAFHLHEEKLVHNTCDLEDRDPMNKLDIYWRDATLITSFPYTGDFLVAIKGDLTTYLATNINEEVYIYGNYGLEFCDSETIEFWIPSPLLMRECYEVQKKSNVNLVEDICNLKEINISDKSLFLKNVGKNIKVEVPVKGNKDLINLFLKNNWKVSKKSQRNNGTYSVMAFPQK